jgi:predicted kinase
LAEKRGIPVHIIRLEASERITKERVSKKRPDSDADFTVYQLIKENYEPLVEEHLVLHSDEDWLEDMIQKAMDYMGKRSTAA